MTTVDTELRQAMHDLAEQGRPVDLGRAALAGARRRRTRFGVAGTVLAAAAAIALPLTLTGGAPTEEVAPSSGAERVVITHYLGGADSLPSYALDPDTGEYHREATLANSPDLRRSVNGSGTYVTDLADGSQQRIPWPQPAADVIWSPDGAHLAGVAEEGYPGSSSSVLVADLAADTGWEIPLELPTHHGIHGLIWLDQQSLAVPIAELRRQGGPDGSDGHLVAYEVRIFDLDGTLVGRLPVDQSDYAATGDPRQLWHVSHLPSDGRVVLVRHPKRSTMEIATLGAPGLEHRATLTLPDLPEGHEWWPRVVLELTGDRLLVAAEQQAESGDSEYDYYGTTHYVVDLTTGQVRPARVPDLPGNGRPWSYADAAALGDDAAHRAFTP